MHIITALFALICGIAPAAAQQPANVDGAVKAAFPTAPADWAARLTPDETMALCSAHRNGPPKAVADAIQKREQATIVYPPDNNFVGDWRKGEALAQSGYGLRFTDYPARQQNGGNCYACHQITKSEVSFGTLGPSLGNYGKIRDFDPADAKGPVREDLQFQRRVRLLDHAALRREQDPDYRADQGHRGAADEPGESGEYRQVAPDPGRVVRLECNESRELSRRDRAFAALQAGRQPFQPRSARK
jgi:sulfur-oxidizing protein SoxX